MEKEFKTFTSVLKYCGFKKMDTKGWLNPSSVCYENKEKGWFADILDRGAYKEVWMVGNGLKSGSFPGGWIYGNPNNIFEELQSKLS